MHMCTWSDMRCPSTILDSLSKSEIATLFQQVLLICDQEGLIGKELFAIDGCKLPSNASKEWSGTHDELKKKKAKNEQRMEKKTYRKNRRGCYGSEMGFSTASLGVRSGAMSNDRGWVFLRCSPLPNRWRA